jgi:uncharacterized protein (DUF342 family)
MMRKAMPHLKFCSIQIENSDLAMSFTYNGHIELLPKTQKNIKIVNTTNTYKRKSALPTTSHISRQQMLIIKALIGVLLGSDIKTKIRRT